MRRVLVCVVGLVALGMMTSGCATMIHGKTQRIDISTSPSGAKVTARGQVITSPGSMEVRRSRYYTMVVSKDGYRTAKVTLKQRQSMWSLLDFPAGLFLFFGATMGLDGAMGGLFTQDPDEITTTLTKLAPGQSAAAPNDSRIVTRPDLTTGSVFESVGDANRVRVCFFLTRGSTTPEIRVSDGDDAIGVLKDGTFVCWERKPGPVTVTVDMGLSRRTTQLTTVGGKTYFLQLPNQFCKAADIIDENAARRLTSTHRPVPKEDYVPFD